MPHIFTDRELTLALNEEIRQAKERLTFADSLPHTNGTDLAQEIITEKVTTYKGKAMVTRHRPDDYDLVNSKSIEKSYRPFFVTSGYKSNIEIEEKNPSLGRSRAEIDLAETTRVVLETEESHLLYGDKSLNEKGVANATGINEHTISTAHTDAGKTAAQMVADVDAMYNSVAKAIPGQDPNKLYIDTRLAAIWRTKRLTSTSGTIGLSVMKTLQNEYSGILDFVICPSFSDKTGKSTFGMIDARKENIQVVDLSAFSHKEDLTKLTRSEKTFVCDKKMYLRLRKAWSVTIAEGATNLDSFKLNKTDY